MLTSINNIKKKKKKKLTDFKERFLFFFRISSKLQSVVPILSLKFLFFLKNANYYQFVSGTNTKFPYV